MPITAITIENFKGIKEPVRVELKPITLLLGPNSAGKSTIVQALHYAREIFARQNLNPDRTLLGGTSVDLGGFESMVYEHDRSLPIRFSFELDLTNEDLPDYMASLPEYALDTLSEYDGPFATVAANVQTAAVEVEIRWDRKTDCPFVSRYGIAVNADNLLEITSNADGLHIGINKLNPCNPVFFEQYDHPMVTPGDERSRKYFRPTPEEAATIIKKFIDQFENGQVPEDISMDVATSEVDTGLMLPWLFHYFETESSVPGITAPMILAGQKNGLPVWGKTLSIEGLAWNEGFDDGEIPNFIRMISTLTVGPGEMVRDWLCKLCYIGPLRTVPGINHKAAITPEESRWADGLAAYDLLHTSNNVFLDKVNEWLTDKDRLDSGYTVEVKKYRELAVDHPVMLAALQGRILDDDIDVRSELQALPVLRRLLIRDEARNIELAPQDIGVGISQVLPVIVAALHRKSGLVAIEQPELHIHPAFQVALGDLFIEQIRKQTDLVFLLETHSEHLMLRFLRRIRETGEGEAPPNRNLSPDELSIYFIERGEEAGISCHKIRVDEDGDFIDRWPQGFFAERAKELF